MMKKILAALLCAATVLTVSGCGSKEDVSVSSGADETDEAGAGSGTGKNKGKRPGGNAAEDENTGITYNDDGSINWDSVPYADEADFEIREIGDAFEGYRVKINKYNGNEKVIKIPETFNGSPVMSIYGSWDSEEGVFHQASDIYVKLPSSACDIGRCFSHCDNVTLDFSEPDDYFLIERNTFSDCKNIRVNMPSTGRINIYEEAFSNCTFNGSLTLPDGLKLIEENCFGDPNEGNGPSSIVYLGETYKLKDFDKLLEAVEAANYVDPRPYDDGVLGHSTLKIVDPYGIERYELAGVPRDTQGTYTVPDYVSAINDYAFTGCTSLENVVLHGNLAVYEKAFEGYEGNITFRGKTYAASEFNYEEARNAPSDLPLTDWDSVPYAPASDFEYEVLGMFTSKFVSIKKYIGTSKQVKIPETIDGVRVGSLFGNESFDPVFYMIPDIEVLVPEDVALRNTFASCGGARLYLPDTKIDIDGAMRVLEGGISVVYKGVIYDYEHIEDFYDAVNNGD